MSVLLSGPTESPAPEFIDSGNIPIYDAEGLHDMEVIGNKSWFLLYDLRRTADGRVYREPAFYVRMPNDAVGPGILMTLRNAARVIAAPIMAAISALWVQ